MVGMTKEETISLAKLAEIAGISEIYLRNYLQAGVVPAEKIKGAWRVKKSDGEEFARLAKCNQLPSISEAVRKTRTCVKLPVGVEYYRLPVLAAKMNLAVETLIKAVWNGKIKAIWYTPENCWMIPKEEGDSHIVEHSNAQKSVVRKQGDKKQRRFLAVDLALKDYFLDMDDFVVAFLDCKSLTAEGLIEMLRRIKPGLFYFNRESRLKDGVDPFVLRSDCGDVQFKRKIARNVVKKSTRKAFQDRLRQGL